MRFSEFIGPRPCLEVRLRVPNRVRRVERVVFCFGSLQQVELDESRHAIEIRFAARPDLLERLFGALFDLEAIHGDEHRPFSCTMIDRRTANAPIIVFPTSFGGCWW